MKSKTRWQPQCLKQHYIVWSTFFFYVMMGWWRALAVQLHTPFSIRFGRAAQNAAMHTAQESVATAASLKPREKVILPLALARTTATEGNPINSSAPIRRSPARQR